MRYGFPMNFKGTFIMLSNERNAHPSAHDYPEHVDSYLMVKEIITLYVVHIKHSLLGKIHTTVLL